MKNRVVWREPVLLPVTVILLACLCPLHAHVGMGNTRANRVCSARMPVPH